MGENSCVRKDRRAQLESQNSARKESLVRSSVPQAMKLVRRKIRLKLSYHRIGRNKLEGQESDRGDGRMTQTFWKICHYATYGLF